MAHLNVAPRIFARRPPSVILQDVNVLVSSNPGGTPYSEIQHPTEPRVFVTGTFSGFTGMAVFDISDRSDIQFVGMVTAADTIMGNQVVDGLAFDSTGRYLYATDGGTNLYTFDLGAAFADIDDPPLVGSPDAISQGNGKHVLKRIGSNLYILADTATNNSFQVVSVATPSNPSVSSTTAMTGHDLEAVVGHVNAAGTHILYPATDSTGKIIAVPIASPSSVVALQLPTYGGLQVRCAAGIAFSPDDSRMFLLCNFVNGTINHYIRLIYNVAAGYSTALSTCTNEKIVNGAIATLRSGYICSSPHHAFYSGGSWNDGNDVLHLAICIRDDSFGELPEMRFYAWGAGGDFSRIPRFSGSTRISEAYSMRARNLSSAPNEWLSVGVAADRTNLAVATLESDLLESDPDYVNDWFEFEDFLSGPGIDLDSGMQSDGHVSGTGTFNFQLNNSEINADTNLGGYSPDSANPVTAEFKVGSPIILTLNTGAGDVPRFYGTVTDIRPIPNRKGPRYVEVACKDGMKVLHEVNVERLPLLSNITTDEALKILFDRVPYLAGAQFFRAGEDSFVHDYINDRAYDEKNKYVSVIRQLTDASQGFVFPSHAVALGEIVYKSLDEYKLSAAYNGGHTILDTNIVEMEVEHSDQEIYNHVTVRGYPREVDTGANTVLFTMQKRISLKAGETKVIDASFRDPIGLAARVAGVDMVYPVAATDFTLRTRTGGGGANINAQASCSAEFGATGARIIATNAGPTMGWFKTQLRGNGVYTQEPFEVFEQDPDSITEHQLRELFIDAPYIDNEEDARRLARAHLQAKKDPRTFVKTVGFYLKDSGPTVPAATIGLTGKVGVQESLTGLTAPDWWTLGTGKLGDSAGADNANLYGLDLHSVQKVRINIKGNGLAKVELSLIPEDSIFRISSWIDPRETWLTGEPISVNPFDLHLYDDVRAIWHEKAVQSADVSKTDTTLADATDGKFFLEAGDTAHFIAFLFVDSSDAANAKVSVVGFDAGFNDISALLSGRIQLWGNGDPVTTGTSAAFGTGLNVDLAGANEDVIVLSGRVTTPIAATIQIQVAQNSASGTSTFRQLSTVIPFLVDRKAA